MDLLRRIINNHIRDEAMAILEGDIELAKHINNMYEMYIGAVVMREGVQKGFLYDLSRKQYIKEVTQNPSKYRR